MYRDQMRNVVASVSKQLVPSLFWLEDAISLHFRCCMTTTLLGGGCWHTMMSAAEVMYVCTSTAHTLMCCKVLALAL